jgi:hypothetical protein
VFSNGTSQSGRAMTECIFGWGEQHGTMRKTKHRGISAVAADFSVIYAVRSKGTPFGAVLGNVELKIKVARRR